MLASLPLCLTHQSEVIASAARATRRNVCLCLSGSISGASTPCKLLIWRRWHGAQPGWPEAAAQAQALCPPALPGLPGGSLKGWMETCEWWPVKLQNSAREVFESQTFTPCCLSDSATEAGRLHCVLMPVLNPSSASENTCSITT